MQKVGEFLGKMGKDFYKDELLTLLELKDKME